MIGPEAFALGNEAVAEFLGYLDTLIARRTAEPGDPERDVLTRLIQGETGGEKLTAKELLHNCIFLLNAGHETTTNLIGNGLLALHRHPDQWERLKADPSLIPNAIEELLRYDSSVQMSGRFTTAAVELSGVTTGPVAPARIASRKASPSSSLQASRPPSRCAAPLAAPMPVSRQLGHWMLTQRAACGPKPASATWSR